MHSRVEAAEFVGEGEQEEKLYKHNRCSQRKGKDVFALGYGCYLVWWEGGCETAKECRLRRGRSSRERW